LSDADAEHAPDGRSLQRRVLVGVFLGLLVYAGFALWADLGGVVDALGALELWVVPTAMSLSFGNYLLRFVRWERYRALLGVRMNRRTSFLIHLSGLSLTVTPGKLGEAFKSWLIKEVDGTPVHRTAPIVLAERFTDLLALLVLIAVGGLATQPDYAWVFWATLLLCGALLALLSSASLATLVCRLIARLPLVRGLAPKAERAFESTRVLMAPGELPLAIIAATAGWALEGVAFWVVANGIGAGSVPFDFALYTFALPLVAGAVAIVTPGGLGVTETAMTGLLSARYRALGGAAAVANAQAVSVTLVFRLCTLWFAMGVGLVALAAFRRLRRNT
jgi:uncharacterized protein (TIRG00374 family)